MAGKAKFSRQAVRRAIVGDPETKMASSRGVKSTICARLMCSRQTLDNYLEKYPELQKLVNDERETIVDLAENKLLAALNRDDMRAILFVLETMGKGRGWSKRTEVTGADGAPFGLSPDVIELLRAMGVEPTQAVKEFETLVRQGMLTDG